MMPNSSGGSAEGRGGVLMGGAGVIREVSGWVYEKRLGSGSFGTVSLWKHKSHGTYAAVKQCVCEVTDKKVKQRWIKELELINKMHHPNLISSMYDVVPSSLIQQMTVNGLPPLTMEYCTGGDLRTLIRESKNCCGLHTHTLYPVISDVCDGVVYLHQNGVIHRDLKPENVVIQPHPHGRHVYKIIDLGCSKELHQNSVMQTHVGTQQYVAPELFLDKSYSYTVDLWSLGVMVFECICIVRPFSHMKDNLRERLRTIQQKKDDIIYMAQTGDTVKMNKSLCKPNWLCSTTCKYFENLLRLLLRSDPKTRGVSTPEEKYAWYDNLQNILQQKIVYIFDVSTCTTHSYPINEDTTVSLMYSLIDNDVPGVTKHSQLLTNKGVHLKHHTKLLPYAQSGRDYIDKADTNNTSPTRGSSSSSSSGSSSSSSSSSTDKCLYLITSSVHEGKVTYRTIPTVINNIIKDPKSLRTITDARLIYIKVYQFCVQVSQDWNCLYAAQDALLKKFYKSQTDFSRTMSELEELHSKLSVLLELYNQSLNLNIEQHTKLKREQGQEADDLLHHKWQRERNDQTSVTAKKKELQKLQEEKQKVSKDMVTLQYNRPANTDLFNTVVKKVEITLDELLQKIRGHDHSAQSIQPIANLVKQTIKKRSEIYKQVAAHIKCIHTQMCTVHTVTPTAQTLTKDYTQLIDTYTHRYHTLHMDVWSLLQMTSASRRGSHSSGARDHSIGLGLIPRVLDELENDAVLDTNATDMSSIATTDLDQHTRNSNNDNSADDKDNDSTTHTDDNVPPIPLGVLDFVESHVTDANTHASSAADPNQTPSSTDSPPSTMGPPLTIDPAITSGGLLSAAGPPVSLGPISLPQEFMSRMDENYKQSQQIIDDTSKMNESLMTSLTSTQQTLLDDALKGWDFL